MLAKEAQTNLLCGVPMAWMTRWPGSFPIFFDSAQGAHFTDVDGLSYIDFCLGDTGAMTGHALPQVAEALYAQAQRGITTMLPSVDAAWVGAELARRFGLPFWQMAMTATDANRFVLRFARHLTGRSKVLVFERDIHTGRFRRMDDYPRLALATVDTHDLPPLVGWLQQRDIVLRSEVGDLTDPQQQRAMHDARASDRHALIEMLIEAGLLPIASRDQLDAETLIAALHTFIRRTPSSLVGLSLDDLARESEPVNIPGIWQDKYPSWTRRMRETLEELLGDPGTIAMLGER